MILATVRVEDFDRFVKTFSTKGLEKRREHGSKGSRVFRDPNDDSRVWTVFDWDEESFQRFLSDPDMPAIFQRADCRLRPRRLSRLASSTPNCAPRRSFRRRGRLATHGRLRIDPTSRERRARRSRANAQ